MIHLREIIELAKAEALAGRLAPTDSDLWRYFCREYSKTFHTPLHIVLELSPEKVMLAVFEDQLEKRNLNSEDDFNLVVEELRRLQDPDYDANSEKEMQDFVAGIEAFEEERISKGAPIPRPNKKAASEKEDGFDPADPTKGDKEPEVPKQGYVDLSKFSQDEES